MALSPAAVSVLGETFTGEVVLPGDSGYDQARAVWNGMIDRHPAVVVRPTGVPDVVAAVRWAREQTLDIAVRCGGHSIPGLSTCDDGIVIDLSAMNSVDVDAVLERARVAGGALLGDLDRHAQQVGLVCPVGVVSHTGVAGLTLGGGMGRLQRRFGLTIDNVLSVELVTADGRVVQASDEENPELFWGLRGAGANFGIATSFEYRLHPFDGTVTHGSVVHPIERATELAGLFRQLVDAGPDELWCSFAIALAEPGSGLPDEVAGRPIAVVSVLHSGPVAGAERELAELRALGPPLADNITVKPYLATQQLADEAMAWGHRFSMKSVFLDSFPDKIVRRFAQHVSRAPVGTDCDFSVWSGGRAITDVAEDATAFTGRAGTYWVSAEALWDDPGLDESCRSWARAALADVEPHAVVGRYVNDVAEVEQGLGRSIYGGEKYERLVGLKRTWDPENVFRLNQNISP
jgi:FAD/FMN-containing dehydrogenase